MGIHQQANTVRKDVYPSDAWKAVKLAIRQTVARAGGVDAVASQCRVSHKARVSEWQSAESDDFPSLWQVGQLEAFAGVDWITQAMCALHDGDLVKRSKLACEGEILARIGAAAKEGGEAISSSASLLSNPGCINEVNQTLREIDEAIRSKRELRAAIEALVGGAV